MMGLRFIVFKVLLLILLVAPSSFARQVCPNIFNTQINAQDQNQSLARNSHDQTRLRSDRLSETAKKAWEDYKKREGIAEDPVEEIPSRPESEELSLARQIFPEGEPGFRVEESISQAESLAKPRAHVLSESDVIHDGVLANFSPEKERTLRSLRNQIRVLRGFNGARERARIQVREQWMTEFNHDLGLGISARMKKKLENIFYNCELATLVISNTNNPDLKVEYEKLLGEHYSFYYHFRRFLERIIPDKSKTRDGRPYSERYRQTARDVYNSLGLGKSNARVNGDFARTVGIQVDRRLTLEEVTEAFENSYEAVKTKLTVDRKSELFTSFQTFLLSFPFVSSAQTVSRLISLKFYNTQLPEAARVFLKFIFGELRDSRTRKIDIPKMREVLLLKTDNPLDKLQLLRVFFLSDKYGTLLPSMARVYEYRSLWRTLLAVAEAQVGDGIADEFDRDFVELMKRSETIGFNYGQISETEPPTFASRLATWLQFGVTAGASYYYSGNASWPGWSAIDYIVNLFF